jgi:GNAT superfamily N-acetyltransferase
MIFCLKLKRKSTGINMRIIKISGKKEMKDFVRLPERLFKENPCYVPPIWMDEKKAYYGEHNPILKNSDFELFIAINDEGVPIGRNLAYIDHTFNKFYNTKMGFFGAFECIDNDEAGRLLVKAAEEWLLEKGMDTVRGPIHPVAENWGFVLEGYEAPPVYMSPWNPPYYHKFFTDYGYEKAKDLFVYEGDSKKGYQIPERFERFYNKFFERYPNFSIRRINMKRIKEDARSIWEISNTALADNWGYVPLELPVMEDMLRKLKMIVDPDAVWIIEDNGKAAGYCLGFPDINRILKKINGKLFPFGWAKLIFGAKKLTDYRLFALAVHPDWHRQGLDVLLYTNICRYLSPKNVRLEANYILEDNYNIKNALEKLGLERSKTYRIYEKPLA